MRVQREGSKGRVARPALLLALSASLLVAPATSGALSDQARLDSTVRFLQEAQNADGGFGGSPGAKSGQLFTAWVALALAAAGINPQDQALPGGTDASTYLVTHYRQGIAESDCAPIACTTTFERELMVVNASGTSPRDFGGVDLVEELLDRARPDGAFPHVPGGQPGVNDTIFAIFALAPIANPAAQAPIQRAADWVEYSQQEVGGWAWSAGSAPHEVDMTGAAIQSLVAAGRPGNASVQRGLDYLHKAQNPDGGFPEFPGEPESNAASTCWAAQAIWAAGENPETWLTDSGKATEEPLDYLESLQAPDGHIRWKTSDDLNGVWMTAYCTPAFAGQAWPIPAAPRSSDPIEPPKLGRGGGTQAGDGVLSGGGAGGAPLFSRPKPQSKGKTPGGARAIENRGIKARNHSRTRRGANTEQPTRTQNSEATSAGASEAVPAGSGQGPRAGTGTSGPAGARGDGRGPGASSAGAGSGGGGPRSPALAAASRGSTGGGTGREVTGTLIGSVGSSQSDLHFGAPGLHGAGVEGGDEETVALVIGAAALSLVLGGAGWERRRQEAVL
jgi:prenyltransferase beta subunit